MYSSLLKTSKPLLRHKIELSIAAVGLVVMTLSFGAGLGLLLPIFNYLLKEGKNLGEIIDSVLNGPLEQIGDNLASFVPSDPFYGFMSVMVCILAMTMIGGIGRFVSTYMVTRTTLRVVEHWRVLLYRNMVRMDMASNWLHGIAEGSSRIMSDVEQLGKGYNTILVRSAQATTKVIMALVVAFIINWQLTLLALIGGPVIVIVVRKMGKSMRKASMEAMKAQASMLMRINESLSDLRVTKMSQSERSETRRFFSSAQRAFREQLRRQRIRAVSSLVVEIIAMVGVILVAGFSAWAIFRKGIPASDFMMILGALVAAGASFKPLSNLHHALIAADAAAERILDLNEKIIAEPDTTSPELQRHHETLRFESIVYTYPGAKKPALQGITLEIEFGQMVAIVGGNGSGKSTLVAALTRLITPDSGKVLIDGQDVFEHGLRSVRAQMAMVTQKTKLFQGSLWDNIAYGRSWVDQQKIIAAAKDATADLFIKDLPDGYDTMIGEGGEGLSGGQAQRVCIARALLRDPAILILDEATSQVDTTSEALIADAMHQITEGRTTLVIAHRMSTVVNADRIIVMEDGKIVGQGKHQELLDSCPQYQALASGQLVGPND